jgi:hypothetical protein
LTEKEIAGREGCYGDYNNMVVRFQPVVVPLPPYALLLGSGILGLLGLGWLRRGG